MPRLRPVPWPVWCITAGGVLVTSAAVIGQHVIEMIGGDDSGLLYPVLVGVVPVFTWIAVGITNSILLVRRSRERQRRGELPKGWGKRVLTSFAWVLALFALAVAAVGMLWLGGDLWIAQRSAQYTGSGDEFALPRTLSIVIGLVFGPGITGALPGVLMAASATPEDDY